MESINYHIFAYLEEKLSIPALISIEPWLGAAFQPKARTEMPNSVCVATKHIKAAFVLSTKFSEERKTITMLILLLYFRRRRWFGRHMARAYIPRIHQRMVPIVNVVRLSGFRFTLLICHLMDLISRYCYRAFIVFIQLDRKPHGTKLLNDNFANWRPS